MTTEAEYKEWLLDVSRDPYRIMLIEVDHSAGTLYFASDDWMSETFQPYDGWLISEPQIEDSLDSFHGVGDFDIAIPDTSTNWMGLSFRGYPCRWYYGDKTWVKADFKRIAHALVDSFRSIGPIQYRVDLMDSGQSLRRTWPVVVTSYGSSARSLLNDVMAEASLPAINFTNISEVTRIFRCYYDVDDKTQVISVVEDVARSIGAYSRMRQDGQLELFIVDRSTVEHTITEDDIEEGSVSMVDVIHPYKNVIVVMDDGTEVERSTTASTGDVDETFTLNTVLRDLEDAETIADELKLYYAIPRSVWRLRLFDIAGVLQVGDYISVEHSELTTECVVSWLKRAPLSSFTEIEVTV